MNCSFDHYLIRSYRSTDAEDLYGILSDPQLMRFMDKTYTMEETAQFLSRYALGPSPYVYALEDLRTGKLAGHIIFHRYDEKSLEIGWIISADHQGRGLAQRITEELIQYGLQKNFRNYVIECSPEHQAVIHIAEKMGFHYELNEDGLLVFRKTV